jgi:hypothetical protein
MIPYQPAASYAGITKGSAGVSKMFRKKCFLVLAVVLCMVTCIDLLPWAVLQSTYIDDSVVFSAANLSSIGGALHAYYEDHGNLPPATVIDKDGRPLYSWRVLLLPYLDLEMAKQFKLDEPWDGPHNKLMLEKDVHEYRCRAARDSPGMTRYKAFVGPGTAFGRSSVKWDDLAEKALVVIAGEAVPWSKPADLTYDPDGPLPQHDGAFKRPTFFHCFYLGQEQGFLALFGNGKVCFLRNDTQERVLRDLITRNSGEKKLSEPE